MKTQVEEKFSDFFQKWFCQLEENLQHLLKVPREACHDQSNYEALVSKLTAHHKAYYTAKWAAAHDDVLAFFSPVWLSSLENAYLWVTGWKPSMMFRLVDSLRQTGVPGASLAGLSEEQLKRIEELRVKIRLEEEKVEREMERQQVAMADPRMVELARLATRVKDGNSEVSQVDELVKVALKSLLAGLEREMKMADCVRLKTLKGVLDVLSPLQCVDFLAATSMHQIQLSKWGKKRENRRRHENENCATLDFRKLDGKRNRCDALTLRFV
ncbi:hypothetical protein F0562_018117 [Nyssa sinensis]|uniref:DOG1 domain-containing protein n=1 Tax=Nyssa sinensis TaxID=561372 RepID=A0A5J4ZBM4_9ASTE|nr:hypothetical protein F0562_018117 [Nyssa sinensis]